MAPRATISGGFATCATRALFVTSACSAPRARHLRLEVIPLATPLSIQFRPTVSLGELLGNKR